MQLSTSKCPHHCTYVNTLYTYSVNQRKAWGMIENAIFSIAKENIIVLSSRKKTQEWVSHSNNLSAFIKEIDKSAENNKAHWLLGFLWPSPCRKKVYILSFHTYDHKSPDTSK